MIVQSFSQTSRQCTAGLTVNMSFNSTKFEWVSYSVGSVSAPAFQYLSPDQSDIEFKESPCDLGVILSSPLTFNLQVEKVVTTAIQMVGWGLRTFRSRYSFLLLTMFKSLVRPHLDYCSQLLSPTAQEQINKIEAVQRSLITRMKDNKLQGLSYWEKT